MSSPDIPQSNVPLSLVRIERSALSDQTQPSSRLATSRLAALRKQSIEGKQVESSQLCAKQQAQTTAECQQRLAAIDDKIDHVKQTISEHLASALTSIADLERHLAQLGEQEMCTLILDICKNFVGSTYKLDASALPSIISEDIRKFSSEATITVTMHPDDVMRLRRKDAAVSDMFSSRVNIKSDESFATGDYLIESLSGKIDGRLSAKFEHLRSSLLAAFTNQEDGNAC